MLNYLNYVLAYLHSNHIYSGILCDEINTYKSYWSKYNADCSKSPLYKSVPVEFDRHCIILPTNEKIFIRWDIESLYQCQDTSIKYFTLNEFDSIVATDLANSIEEISKIYSSISSIYTHRYNPILLMNFRPIHCCFILDGRHRYAEYKKFKPNSSIPAFILDDEQCFSSIIYKCDLVAYIILHNIEVINNYVLGIEPLARLIKMRNYI